MWDFWFPCFTLIYGHVSKRRNYEWKGGRMGQWQQRGREDWAKQQGKKWGQKNGGAGGKQGRRGGAPGTTRTKVSPVGNNATLAFWGPHPVASYRCWKVWWTILNPVALHYQIMSDKKEQTHWITPGGYHSLGYQTLWRDRGGPIGKHSYCLGLSFGHLPRQPRMFQCHSQARRQFDTQFHPGAE